MLQNKAAQIVTKSPPRSERKVMYDRLDWLTVNQLVAYHTLLQIFKIRKSYQPEYLFEILGRCNRNGNILITNTELSLAKKGLHLEGLSSGIIFPQTSEIIIVLESLKRIAGTGSRKIFRDFLTR